MNIAVLHKLANRNAEALSNLESLLPVLNTTRDSELLAAWWYLGELIVSRGERITQRPPMIDILRRPMV